jgi:uncharacterized membrane protein YcaP (DUF421 family)
MDIVIRAAIVYAFVFLVLRALGKRELGELTAFELVLLFIIGDLVQQSITQNDTSITAAVLAISTISLLILVQSYAVFRWKWPRPIVAGEPVVVIYDGNVLERVLHRERMTTDQLTEAARKQGINDLGDVHLGVLESDGKLSFLSQQQQHSGGDTEHEGA